MAFLSLGGEEEKDRLTVFTVTLSGHILYLKRTTLIVKVQKNWKAGHGAESFL